MDFAAFVFFQNLSRAWEFSQQSRFLCLCDRVELNWTTDRANFTSENDNATAPLQDVEVFLSGVLCRQYWRRQIWTSDAGGLDHCPKGGKYLAHFTCWLWAKFVNSDGCSFLQMHGFGHYEGQHGRLQWWTSEQMLANPKRSGATVGTVIHLNWESSLSAPTICNMSRTSLGGCRYAKSTGTALRLSWSSVAGVVKTVRPVCCLSNSTHFFLLLTLMCLPWVVPCLVQTASTPRSSCLCKSSGHRCKKEAATGSTDANKMLSELWDDKCSCVWDSLKAAVQNLMRSTRDWRHTHTQPTVKLKTTDDKCHISSQEASRKTNSIRKKLQHSSHH